MSDTRETLEKASFFLQLAREGAPQDRKHVGRFVEAAVVFARSVTFHLQKEFASHPDFSEWYVAKQELLRSDPLCRFFVERRNFILKQGPLPIRRRVLTTFRATVVASASVNVKVVRGKPWYRRSPRILLQDALAPVREAWHNWKRERQRRSKAHKATPGEVSSIQELLHFDDPDWQKSSALDLIGEYLEKLGPIVDEAERRFGASPATKEFE